MKIPWKTLLFGALLVATWLFLSPSPPGGGANFLLLDKLAHACIFAALAILSRRAYAAQPPWGAFAALVFYGGCIELAQGRAGRDMDVFDLVADAVGAAAAFLVPRRR